MIQEKSGPAEENAGLAGLRPAVVPAARVPLRGLARLQRQLAARQRPVETGPPQREPRAGLGRG